jgi:hypothetical protein
LKLTAPEKPAPMKPLRRAPPDLPPAPSSIIETLRNVG